MNRQQFMEELKMRLKRLPYDEIKVAVDYYEEYFDEAGEEVALKELGSPAEVASKIISEFAMREKLTDMGTHTNEKKKLSKLWIVLLSIFASPIALPVGLTFVLIIFSILLVVFSLILSFGIVGVGLGISGIVAIIASVFLVALDFATTMFFVGVGLALVGLGLIFLRLTYWTCVKSFAGLTSMATRFLRKGVKA